MKTILIYSGGMDSTTLLYKLLQEGDAVRCLSFDYGQRHRRELLAAHNMCSLLSVPNEIVDITNVKHLLGESALISESIHVPEGHYEDQSMRTTVVPNRNMIFLSIAIGAAVAARFDRVAIAVHAGDHAIYPDCRTEFIESMNTVSKISNYESIEIHAPFLHCTKRDIAAIGKSLGVPFGMTWTCYKGLHQPCGKCGACVERNEALGFTPSATTAAK